jgi:predicted permease
VKTTGVRWMDILRLRWRSLSWRSRLEDELDDELRFHVESLVERFTADGLHPDEARRRAALEIGGIEAVKEYCRDRRGVSALENLGRDIVYAWRGMRKSPGFVLTAAAAIALGIGVNIALFSVVYSLMFRGLPVSDPDSFRNVHVATFGEGNRSGYGTRYNVSWHEFNYIRTAARTAEIGGLAEVEMSRRGDTRPIRAQLVSDNLLSLTGSRPALGRFFAREETSQPGSAAVTVLSHRVWQDRFAGAPDIIGQAVVLNRQPFTIVGVADERTMGPVLFVPDLWIPLSMQAVTRAGEPLIDSPTSGWIQVFARRKPGYSDDALSAEMQVLAQQALQPHLPKRTAQVSVEPGAYFNFPFVKQQFTPLFAIVTLAVSLVLIVACANVANMLLARGLTRRREIAIRLAIGAGRARLLQQLLTESVMLAVVGGAGGLLLAWGGARLLVFAVPAESIGRHQLDPSPDLIVLLATLGIALLTGLVFGLLPALSALRFDLTPALRTEGLEDHGPGGRRRLQNVLIGVQVAVCLVLLVNAGLLVRGFVHALRLDPGASTRNVLIAGFDLRQQQYTAGEAAHFMNRLREAMSSAPGVLSVSNAFVEPLHDQCGNMISIPDGDGSAARDVRTSCNEIGTDFFRTAGIRLLYGREFTPAEMFDAARVAVIDERLARDHFGSPATAVSATIRLGQTADSDHQIVGVAASVRALDLNQSTSGTVYTPMRGLRNNEGKLLVAYAGPAAGVDKAVRAAVASIDPNVTPHTKRIEESLRAALLPARIAAAAASVLGGLALILACTGVYGLVSFAVSRRRREVGIRMALGADRLAVMRLMVWQGMKPVLVGGIAGLLLASAGAQAVRALLYGISPFDPLSFGSTAFLLACVAAAAAVIPARAALRVDPAVTLKHD